MGEIVKHINWQEDFSIPTEIAFMLNERPYGLDTEPRCLDVVLDIGANVGVFSVAAIERGAKTVIACEPDAQNYTCLVENVRKCDLWGAILPLPIAVLPGSETFGTAILRSAVGAENNCGQRSLVYKDSFPGQAVFGIGFNALVKSVVAAFGKIDCLKMDIEGGEWDIVRHSEFHLDGVQYVKMEIHQLNHPAYFDPHAEEGSFAMMNFVMGNCGFECSRCGGRNLDYIRKPAASSEAKV